MTKSTEPQKNVTKTNVKKLTNITIGTQKRAGLAQSIWRIAMGFTVRGSNPGGRRDCLHPSRPALGPTQPAVKRPGSGVDHPPPSSAEVKERVEIHL